MKWILSSSSYNFSIVNRFPKIGHARNLLASVVQVVFVASHDYGIPGFLTKSIILQTFGINYNHPCDQDFDNVVIPPYISLESVRAMTTGKKKRNVNLNF
ncbi:putative glucuronoxylan glucuronosyltransferase F8H [Morella rubra]|uniref:Putative glucuronoxylan glucuronosyltransferase F8H n=1 Tax=Morella rubra TaxID=262757 RepID=A0A6A1WSW8_9ROSI|nr:putative glucuronoxylan glucuronosyltransferase F8H [Morella rubra]